MPIAKTSYVSDKDFRLRDADVRTAMERQEMIEALRHGNIYEVFAKSKTFKIGDFLDFFANQWKSYKGQIVQDAEIKAMEASCAEPDMDYFPMHHKGITITPDEGKLFSEAMAESLFKGGSDKHPFFGQMKAQSAKAEEIEFESDLPDAGVLTSDEMAGLADGTLDEWDVFLEETWGTIFDQQMMADYRQRMSEIQTEVQRIITLAKQGAVGPEFVLIALAKVNQTKNGCLMTWLGKKAFHVNEVMNNAAADLKASGGTDFGLLQDVQSKTRDGSFNLNLLTQDMQKVMQDVAGTLEFVHSFLGEINRSRREIVQKFTAH